MLADENDRTLCVDDLSAGAWSTECLPAPDHLPEKQELYQLAISAGR